MQPRTSYLTSLRLGFRRCDMSTIIAGPSPRHDEDRSTCVCVARAPVNPRPHVSTGHLALPAYAVTLPQHVLPSPKPSCHLVSLPRILVLQAACLTRPSPQHPPGSVFTGKLEAVSRKALPFLPRGTCPHLYPHHWPMEDGPCPRLCPGPHPLGTKPLCLVSSFSPTRWDHAHL